MLSAIAVNVQGQTSDGFFSKAKELGKLDSDDPADQQTFWEAEKKAVYKTWQKSFKAAAIGAHSARDAGHGA